MDEQTSNIVKKKKKNPFGGIRRSNSRLKAVGDGDEDDTGIIEETYTEK